MRDTYIIILLFISAFALAAGHSLAIEESWYYLYPVVDIPLHILGGFVVGLAAAVATAVVREQSGESRQQVGWRELSIILLATVFVTILWEAFELVFYLTTDAGLSRETLSDIYFGISGGIFSWVVLWLLPRE